MKKKDIKFNHFSIEVLLLPKDEKNYEFEFDGRRYVCAGDEDACCFEGNRVQPFGLVFRESWSWRELVHECWHLFFKILRYMGGKQTVTYDICEREIFAYRFTDLCDSVYEALEELASSSSEV